MIEIPFLQTFRGPMLAGAKTMTTRFRRYGRPGDFFDAFGSIFVLTDVRRETLGAVADNYYMPEGFSSPAGFWKCWRAIHPKRDQRGLPVWVHRFRLAKTYDRPERLGQRLKYNPSTGVFEEECFDEGNA